jgi:membrane associated rhomboid family serine protease
MHGSLMHIGGNLLYLWIFGDQIEDVLGHAKFAVFYLLCGFAADFAQIAVDPDSRIPTLGASGAIAGVLGAYLVKYPRNSVRVFAMRFLTTMPAFVVLGLWIVLQVVSQMTIPDDQAGGGGVAYMAHIGGFIAGLVLVFLFGAGRRVAANAGPLSGR